MRKQIVIAVLVAAVACLALAGCSSSESSSAAPAASESATAASAAAPENYEVTIVGSETVEDSAGGNVLLVSFDYTNNTKTAVNFQQAITTVASQGGVQAMMSSSYVGPTGSDGTTPDFMLKVEPGATARVHMVFALNNMDPVTVRCTQGFVDGGYPDMTKVLAEATLQP